LNFLAVFNTVFWRIAEDSYPNLTYDDPELYMGEYSIEDEAKDEFRRQYAGCIEETFQALNVPMPEGDDLDQLTPVYQVIDSTLPVLMDWISED